MSRYLDARVAHSLGKFGFKTKLLGSAAMLPDSVLRKKTVL